MRYKLSLISCFRYAYVVLVVLLCASGCKVTRVTQAEVEQRIQRELQVDARPDQVLVFLNSLSIGGLKAEHGGYIPDVPAFPRIPPEGPAIVKGGHIYATIRNASRDDRQLQVYSINIDFLFNSDNRLTGYTLQTQGDW
ncbi:MAG: hypothetical protein DMF60_15790 [Acidobacteria bacterium]|nr:MAG: hypothetical protein DMF60_15790 [Acidobacteriota bacterium]